MPTTHAELSWQVATLKDIDVSTFHAIAKLRVDVFVVEQACIYPEFDGLDTREDTWHIIGKHQQQVVAYARVMGPDSTTLNAPVHIGRVLVAADYRGAGLARQLFEQSLHRARAEWPEQGIALSAQVQVVGFYEAFDFKTVSDVYMEDGIPHVDMVWNAHG